MICLEMNAGMGIGLESSTSSHMSMNKLELAMTLREQRMGLSCTRSVKHAGGGQVGRGILMGMVVKAIGCVIWAL
jgi:hypothetical protein